MVNYLSQETVENVCADESNVSGAVDSKFQGLESFHFRTDTLSSRDLMSPARLQFFQSFFSTCPQSNKEFHSLGNSILIECNIDKDNNLQNLTFSN